MTTQRENKKVCSIKLCGKGRLRFAALAWLRFAAAADRNYVMEATTKKQDQEK